MTAPSKLDLAAKTAWGLDLNEWNALLDRERAWYRENITKAPNFGAIAK